MALLFRNRTASARGKDAAIELMLQARTMLSVDERTVVSVSQHDCGDPECRGTRTVILIMRPDQPTACLIVAPQRGYDEPAILSYAISLFCPISADGLHCHLTTNFAVMHNSVHA
jgi:hypothetical protein